MNSNGDDRSVKVGGNLTGSSVVTGDNNVVSTHMRQYTLPPRTVDIEAEVAALQELVAMLQDRGKLNRALEDATDETGKANPDKEEVAAPSGGSSNMQKRRTISTNMLQSCCRISRRSGPGSAQPAMRF